MLNAMTCRCAYLGDVREPVLLDLFCGAGGAAMGYSQAGFARIIGVDNKPQPNYPFEFVLADAMTFPLEGFDLIHASPPCQRWSVAARTWKRITLQKYPDLLAPTRARLEGAATPWVIENVPGAPLRGDFVLCGCRFDLELRRRRLFETSWEGFALQRPCLHTGPVVSVVGHGTPTWVREKLGYNPTIKHYRAAMGIDWMNRNELSQAIPPAYTRYIGTQALAYLEQQRKGDARCEVVGHSCGACWNVQRLFNYRTGRMEPCRFCAGWPRW